MSSLPIKILKDENGDIFIPVTSTLGIDSNGKTLQEEITDLLNRVVGLTYVPARIDVVTTTIETGPTFDEVLLGVIVLEFGRLVTGESLLKFGDYELKTTSVDSEDFKFELTDGITNYSSSNIDKDVVLDMYNRLIIYFTGTSLIFGLNGVSGGIISAPGIYGIPVAGLSIPSGNDFAIYRLYGAIGQLPAVGLNAITMSDLNFDIDRKIRPSLCYLYYRNFTTTTMLNEGAGSDALDWTIGQGTWVPGYNVVSDISYPGLSQKPSINGITLIGNKTTEDLLIESGGGSWGEIEGTLSDQTDLQLALDGKATKLQIDTAYVPYRTMSGVGEPNTGILASAETTGVNTLVRRTETGGRVKVGTPTEADDATTKTYVDTELDNKVDKIAGKGLSTEDYTTAEKSKLSGIEEGANNYVLPLAALMLQIYPVGSIYMSVNNTNPGDFFGGIWVPWGSGRVPVGVDITDADFNTVDKTGGAKTHTLTTAQIPSHNHTASTDSTGAHSHSGTAASAGDHRHSQSGRQAAGSISAAVAESYGSYGTLRTIYTDYGGAHTHSISTNSTGSHSHTVTVNNSGSGNAHNNLQPFITCYMWKRTA